MNMGDENTSVDSMSDTAQIPREIKRSLFNGPNLHENTLAAAFNVTMSSQDSLFRSRNDENSSGVLSDTAFKPRERKRPFDNPNFHENTLAAAFSNVPSSDQESFVLPIRQCNLLKEKNYDLTFTKSQSRDSSTVSVCSLKQSSQRTFKERIYDSALPNFEVGQSFYETFSQSVCAPSKPTTGPYRFSAPPDLTFGGASSLDATSQESSGVSSAYRSSSTHTNSNCESSSLISTGVESGNSTQRTELSSNFCADQSASLGSMDDTLPWDGDSTSIPKPSETREDDVESDTGSGENNSRLSKFRNTGNTFTKNETSNLTDMSSRAPQEFQSCPATPASVYEKITEVVANDLSQNDTYTISPVRESLPAAQEVVPEPLVENNVSYPAVEDVGECEGDIVSVLQESVYLTATEEMQRQLNESEDPDCPTDLDAVRPTEDDENAIVTQESVRLLSPSERNRHRDMLTNRNPHITFNVECASQTSEGGENTFASQGSVVLTDDGDRKKALDLLREKHCSVNFSVNQGENTTISETVFATRQRFQFDAAQGDDLTFSVPASQRTVSTTLATDRNISDLVEEETLTENSGQNTGLVNTFETVEPSEIESEKVSETEVSRNETESNFGPTLQSMSNIENIKTMSALIRSRSEVTENELNEMDVTLMPEKVVIDLMHPERSNVSEDKSMENEITLKNELSTMKNTSRNEDVSELEEDVIDLMNPQKNVSKNATQAMDLTNLPNEEPITEPEQNMNDVEQARSNDTVTSGSLSRLMQLESRLQSFTVSIESSHVPTNTFNSENLSRFIQSETVFESSKSTMQRTELRDDTRSADDRSHVVPSGIKEPLSRQSQLQKLDNTYTIVNKANAADATHVTGKFDSLVNVSDFDSSETPLVAAAESKAPANEEVERNAESLNESYRFRNTVEFSVAEGLRARSVAKSPLAQSVAEGLLAENITVNEIAKSIEIENEELPPRALLVGHSYCAPLPESLEAASADVLMEAGPDGSLPIGTDTPAPRRRSSRLQAKRSTSPEDVSPLAAAKRSSTSRTKTESSGSRRKSTSVKSRQSARSAIPDEESLAPPDPTVQNTPEEVSEMGELSSIAGAVSPDLPSNESNRQNDVEGMFEETPVIPALKTRRSSKRTSSQNVTRGSSTSDPLTDTPVAPAKKSGRVSKRKSPDGADDLNGVSGVTEMDLPRRKSARLSTKGGYSVRFVDTVHSISTIVPQHSVSEKSEANFPSAASASSKSCTSSEPSLVHKLFANKEVRDKFVQPTAAAPKAVAKRKKAKRTDQLLSFTEDKEIKALPKKPFFPRLADYIHQGLYDVLAEKMRPKYGLQTNAKVLALAYQIKDHVTRITKSDKAYPVEDVEKFERLLAEHGVIETHFDFWYFCSERLLADFRWKAFPLMVQKEDGKWGVRDTKGCFNRILSDEEEESDSS